MQFDRDELLGTVIAAHLNHARIGVVVRGLSGINVERASSIAAKKLNRALQVASVDYKIPKKHASLTFTSSIEKAVLWRSMPDLAGRIVVFVQGEKKRLHSLEDLDSITSRDLSTQLLKQAGKELSSNRPQTKFWETLRSEAATFPLVRIENFVKAINANKTNIDAISNNLWRLGLLKDDRILQANRDPNERLRRNRDLIVEMSQLSEQSRRRMSSVLTKSIGVGQGSLRNALKDVMTFFRLGGDHILRRLDLETVEQIISAGRPLPKSDKSKEGDLGNDDVSVRTRSSTPDRPLRGRALQEAIAELVVRKDKEAERGLHELGENYRRNIEQPQQAEDAISAPGFGERLLQADPPSAELRSFIGSVCKADSWGGILNTESDHIHQAIRQARPEEFVAYNPDDRSQGVLGQCLFSLLRKFDEYLQLEGRFTQILNNLITSRSILLSHLDLLLGYPFVLFGGYPKARNALNNYLAAYSALIHDLRQHDAALHSRDANALRYVIMEILRLEVVYVRTPNEWKALLTPLHVFHLWRFSEILNAAHNADHAFTEQEQRQLAKALPDLPHLLHFAIVSPDITGDKRVDLPLAGSLELLPTYENHTNRFLGNDGLSFLESLLRRWLDYAPYSRPQVRLALVDVPDLRTALNSAAEYFEVASDSRLFIDCYFTRGQNPSGELARLEYDDKDHELARLLQSGKLTLQLHQYRSLGEVAKALSKQPVHIAYLFDQSQYHLGYAPKARQLLVTPLVVTYQYEYSETFQRGTIAPSSEADEGLFADFHFLVHRAAHLPPGQQIRLQHEGEMDLEPINALLQNGVVRWLVAADRVLTPYKLEDAVPLSEQRSGQRELAVWTKSSTRAVGHFVDLLRQFNLQPDPNRVAELLRRFSHIAAGGIFSIPLTGSSARDLREKGFLGTVLAAAWYTNRYPGALIASLDSNLAQQWLKSRPHSAERADLVGLRLQDDKLIVEPIEVKTRAEGSEARVSRDNTTGQRQLEGRAIDQLKSMLIALGPVFGGSDDQPLLTPARREVLKYQLHRECFREVHDPDWQKDWYQILRRAFTLPQPTITVDLRGLLLHVHLEENSEFAIFEDSTKAIARVELGARAIQRLVAPETDHASATDVIRDGEDDEESQGPGAIPSNTSMLKSDQQSGLAYSYDTTVRAGKEEIIKTLPPDQSEAEDLAHSFLRACQSFRIEIAECDATKAVAGPTVWRFYVKLGRGQRIDPLRNSLEDIGREMRRSGLLVTAIPNSDEIALDIPRTNRESVSLSRVLSLLRPSDTPERMKIPIGVTPEGDDIVRELNLMPHLLVGGTTGSGKTVFLYGLLTALLKTHPDPTSLRLLLSTSGPEDFSFFDGLAHLEEGRVIADAGEAIELLQSHVNQIFEERQQQLSDARCRDIAEYNERNSISLPPFVVVVDEFADLADQLAGNKVKREAFYTNIRRIAQLGRKRGVHLVLCTQRPSADLVPTNIRNLMNGRVALHVNDATASRMVLDETGAERLQMRGDLLFKEQATLTRAQGYYVTSEELDRILQPYRVEIKKKRTKRTTSK